MPPFSAKQPRYTRRGRIIASAAASICVGALFAGQALSQVSGGQARIKVIELGPTTANGPADVLPVVRRGESVLPLSTLYKGAAALTGPLSVSVALPPGTSVARAYAFLPQTPESTARWACRSETPGIVCDLTDAARQGEYYALPPEEPAQLFLVVRGGDEIPAPEPGAATVALGAVTATVTAPVPGAVPGATTSVPAEATAGPIPPRISAIVPRLDPSATSSTVGFDVLAVNLGGVATASTRAQPSVSLANVLPASVTKGVSVRGSGWACSSAARAGQCSYRAAVRPGARTSLLRVRWPARTGLGSLSAGWTITGLAGYTASALAPTSDDGPVPPTGTVPFASAMTIKRLVAIVKLALHVSAPNGVSLVSGGATRDFSVELANTGAAPTADVGMRVVVPPGVVMQLRTPGWSCVQSGGTYMCTRAGPLALNVAAAASIRLSAPGATTSIAGRIVLTPLRASGAPAGDVVAIPLRVIDAGDPRAMPSLVVKREGAWSPWTDGSTIDIPARDLFTYRIAISNRGGVALPAGTAVQVSQVLGRAITVESVTPPAGATCRDAQGVSCTLVPAADVPPGGIVGQLQVAVRSDRVADRPAIGAISSRVAGETARESIAMPARVVENPRSLFPAQRVDVIPTAGGRGSLVVTVENRAAGPVASLAARTTLPPGMTVDSARGAGWSCTVSGAQMACTYSASVRGGSRTAGLRVAFRTRPRSATEYAITWRASGLHVATQTRQVGTRTGRLPVRGALSIGATVQPSVIAAPGPGVPSEVRDISLDGTASVGNGLSLSYTWRQRCTTAADVAGMPACGGRRAPRAGIANPHMGTTRATIPVVSRRTTFIFELEITDGSATLTRRVRATAAAPQVLSRGAPRVTSGGTAAAATARAKAAAAERTRAAARMRAARAGASSARATLARNRARAVRENRNAPGVRIAGGSVLRVVKGERVVLSATVSGRATGSRTYAWTQVSGPEVAISGADLARAEIVAPGTSTILAFRVVVTDGAGVSASGQVLVAVDVTTSAQSASLASALRRSRSGGVTRNFGSGTTVDFGAVTGASAAKGRRENQSGDVVAFTGGTIDFGALTIRDAVGTTSPLGITVTAGRLVTPGSWHLDPIPIVAGSPVSLIFGAYPGAPVTVYGQVSAPADFALLPLPVGWSGATTITFAGAESRIEGTAVGGTGGSASLAGTVTTGGIYDARVTARGLASIGASAIDLAGRVTNAQGQPPSTISGAADRVPLVDGVEARNLSVTWAPGDDDAPAMRGSGTIVISSGSTAPLEISATLSYSSEVTWSLALSGGGAASWSPMPGLSISPRQFSGSIGQADGAWAWNATAKIDRWQVTPAFAVSKASVSLSDQCTAIGVACPPGSSFLAMEGTAVVSPPGGTGFAVASKAVIGLGAGGGFALSARAPDITIAPGMTLTDTSLQATYGLPADAIPSAIGAPQFEGPSSTGFRTVVSGSISIPGVGAFRSVAAEVSPDGWSLGAFDADGVSLGSGNGTQSDAYIGWSSYAATMTIDVPGFGTRSVRTVPGAVTVAGGYDTPSWFGKLVGGAPDRVFSVIQFNPANGFFSADIEVPASYTLPAGSSRIEMNSVTLQMRNDALGLRVGVSAGATMSVKSDGGGMSELPDLRLTMSYDVTTTTVTASLSLLDPAGWNDAFGVEGLVVREASISLMVNIATMTPGLKLLASADLPKSLTGPFKVPETGVPVVVGAELSAANPCIDIQVGDSAGSTPVLSLGGGTMTAAYFEFIVAPTGCQLSPETAPIPAGTSLAFDGSILGVDVDVSASLGLAPTSFDATAEIGALTVGGLQLRDSALRVAYNSATGDTAVGLSGAMKMFGSEISVDGSLAKNGLVTSGSLQMAQAATFNVSGFTMTDMMVDVAFATGPGVADVSVSAAGKVDIMGSKVDVDQFEVTLANGVVEEVAFSIDTTVRIDGIGSAAGTFDMDYSASTGDFSLDAAVVLSTTGGFTIGTRDKPATLSISPECVAFNGDLTMGGMFTASLSGTMVYRQGCTQPVRSASGELVQGAPGDFGFAASDVTMSIAGFATRGSVALGKVGTNSYSTVQTSLTLGPQGASADAEVMGEFQSSGDFALTGTSRLDIAGFDLDLAVTARRQGATAAVSGTAQMSLAGNLVQVEGEFRNQGGAVSTTLTGTVPSFGLGGFSIGRATVVVTQSPDEASVVADVKMNVGSSTTGLLAASGRVTFFAVPGGDRFYASLGSTLGLPTLGSTMNGTTTFTNCVDSTCARTGPVSFVMNGTVRAGGFTFAPIVKMASDGSFAATSIVNGKACSGTVNLGAARSQACFGYDVSLFIGSVAPYGALSTRASADVQVQTYSSSPWNKPWKWGWGNWKSYGTAVGASMKLSPFEVCTNVLGSDLCVK